MEPWTYAFVAIVYVIDFIHTLFILLALIFLVFHHMEEVGIKHR